MPGHFDTPEIANAYVKFRSVHPIALVDLTLDNLRKSLMADERAKFDSMVNVGCGSGQTCTMCADYFNAINAIDVSEKQIKVGKENNQFSNISYSVGCAESLPAFDNSIDLVIAGGFAYWFDFKKFFPEVKRVLKHI